MQLIPTLVLCLSSIIASIDSLVVPQTEEMFYVVSPSSGSEKFYLKLSREGKFRLHRPGVLCRSIVLGARYEGSHVREDLACAAILKSNFFATEKNVELVDPCNIREYAQFHPEVKDWYMFKRPYETVNVTVLPSVTQREAVYPCLAKFGGTNELKMYLVSHEYNFNTWIKRKRPKCPQVRGRFVFEYINTEKNEARLVAVAEDPACRLDYIAEDEGHYDILQRDLERISARGQSICKFSAGRKVRICSVGLNAKPYRPEIKFLPFEDRIEPKCEKRELIFEHDDDSFKFTEWVIGCKSERVAEPGTFVTYYVSLGYEPFQFLIYHPYEKNANASILKHHFYSHMGSENSGYIRDK